MEVLKGSLYRILSSLCCMLNVGPFDFLSRTEAVLLLICIFTFYFYISDKQQAMYAEMVLIYSMLGYVFACL